MKSLFHTLLILSLLFAATVNAQTMKKATPVKTATPVKKPAAKKTAPAPSNAAKAAAKAKAKEDSAAAVNALAMQMARKIIMEDSIKKAQVAEQLAADEKLRKEQVQAEEQKVKADKGNKAKSKKEEVAKVKPEKKSKEPATKVPDELRPMPKPESFDPKVWLGMRAMGIGSFLVGKDVTSEFKPYIGYGGGLVVNFALGKKFSFQPEVLYFQEGFVINGETLGEEYKASIVANAVHVPLLLKYSFGEYSKGFFVNVGPYGNYLINSVIDDKMSGGEKIKDKPEKTTIEYGLAGGIGVALPMGKGRLLVEARGTYYLGSTEKDDEPSSARIVTGAFSLGYIFPIGH